MLFSKFLLHVVFLRIYSLLLMFNLREAFTDSSKVFFIHGRFGEGGGVFSSDYELLGFRGYLGWGRFAVAAVSSMRFDTDIYQVH